MRRTSVLVLLVGWILLHGTHGSSTLAQPPKSLGDPVKPGTPVGPGNIAINNSPASELSNLRRELHFRMMQSIDRLAPYKPIAGLKGEIVLSGSTTMNDLEHRWSTILKAIQPDVVLSGKNEGSEAALNSLAKDSKIMVGVSRPVDESDLKLLQSGQCKEPVAITIGHEALSVVVHAKNPLDRVTIETIKAIFAAEKDGRPLAKSWSNVGVTGEFAERPIQIYERDEHSGTSVFLSKFLLSGASLAKPFQICASNNEVCSRIAHDPNGVGLADIHTSYASIRRLPVLVNGLVVEATEENILLGRYPLLRPLLLVFDKNAIKDDNKLRESMIRFVLSREGQIAVMGAGFIPLDSGFINHQLNECLGQQLR